MMLVQLNWAQVLRIDRAISAADHKRKKPLFEAMDAGLAGVSIKIKYGKDGSLTCSGKSFEELYLKPLQARVSANNGWVYPSRPDEFVVLAEIDGDSTLAYAALEKYLLSYQEMLSSFVDGKRNKHAVKLILSGDVPRQQILRSSNRYCTLDEPIQKPDARYDGNSVSISVLNFGKVFSWDGELNMPNMQYHSFISYIKNAHKAGRLVVLRNIPEKPNAWGIFLEANADYLEIEDIEAFVRYWRNRKPY